MEIQVHLEAMLRSVRVSKEYLHTFPLEDTIAFPLSSEVIGDEILRSELMAKANSAVRKVDIAKNIVDRNSATEEFYSAMQSQTPEFLKYIVMISTELDGIERQCEHYQNQCSSKKSEWLVQIEENQGVIDAYQRDIAEDEAHKSSLHMSPEIKKELDALQQEKRFEIKKANDNVTYIENMIKIMDCVALGVQLYRGSCKALRMHADAQSAELNVSYALMQAGKLQNAEVCLNIEQKLILGIRGFGALTENGKSIEISDSHFGLMEDYFQTLKSLY